MSTENALLTILVEKIKNDTLVLPTLPAIALQVRKEADDPNVNLNKMGDVIGKDPSLSARMIKIANSAYLGRTVKVSSINQAVTRIGLSQVKNMATALAMEQLFVSKNELIKQSMAQAWSTTIEVVANSLAAMHIYTSETKNRHLSMDTMTLTALVHNIGVLPILTEAERHSDVFANLTFLNMAIQKLSGNIGAKITQSWGFGDEISQAVEHWRNLQVQNDEVGYLDFLRIGAAKANVLNSQKDAVFNLAIQRGALTDVNQLESPEFNEMRDNARQIFA